MTPSASGKTRRFQTLSASFRATASSSSWVTPTSTQRPAPISPDDRTVDADARFGDTLYERAHRLLARATQPAPGRRVQSPVRARLFIRARWRNATFAASALAGSPLPRLQRRRLQRTAVREAQLPRVRPELVHRVRGARWPPRRTGHPTGTRCRALRRAPSSEAADGRLGDLLVGCLLLAVVPGQHHVRLQQDALELDVLVHERVEHRELRRARSRGTTPRSCGRRPSAPRARRSARCPLPGTARRSARARARSRRRSTRSAVRRRRCTSRATWRTARRGRGTRRAVHAARRVPR